MIVLNWCSRNARICHNHTTKSKKLDNQNLYGVYHPKFIITQSAHFQPCCAFDHGTLLLMILVKNIFAEGNCQLKGVVHQLPKFLKDRQNISRGQGDVNAEFNKRFRELARNIGNQICAFFFRFAAKKESGFGIRGLALVPAQRPKTLSLVRAMMVAESRCFF